MTEALRGHPDVFVTSPKEPHFLAFAGQRVAFTGPGDDVTLNRVALPDLDDYIGLYRGSGGCRARGEGSVSTLYYSERGVETLVRHFADSRLIVILRDPVERAFSSFQLLRARGFEPCDDFEAALDLERERIAAGWHHLWHYAAMGFYARQLAPFLETFDAERVLVLDFEALRTDPDQIMTRVCRFLDVSPLGSRSIPCANASGEPRNRAVQGVFARIERTWAARRLVSTVVPRRTRDWVRGRNLARVAPSPEAVARLRELYRDDTATLRRMLAWSPAGAVLD